MTRSGYLHALEGVIAALIVVFYLTNIVTVPATTDWTPTHVAQESEDVLRAMDQAGVLDRIILRGDRDSFNALMGRLDSSLSYYLALDDIPKAHIDTGVLVNSTHTVAASSTQGNWTDGSGLGGSEAGYRHGNLSTVGIGDVPFALTDTVYNGIRHYTAAHIDVDGDDVYEGPYGFSDRFCTNGAVCYELAPFNTTVRLYNATATERLAGRLGNVSLGERRVSVDVGTVNPAVEDHHKFDALVAYRWNRSELTAYQDALEAFLRQQGLLIVTTNVAQRTFRPGTVFNDTLNFRYRTGFSLLNTPGDTTNLLYSPHGAGNASYTANNYYLATTITVTDVVDRGTHDEARFALRGDRIRANISDPDVDGTDEVAFGTESFETFYDVGDRVYLKGNAYGISAVTPLRLNPDGQQRFDRFGTLRIAADYHATKMREPRFNTSLSDTQAPYTDQYQNRSDITPSSYSSGLVGTECAFDTYPYRKGTIPILGDSHTFMLINFEVEAPCNDYYEFVYVDLNQDGDVSDDADATGPGTSGEGPFQAGDTLTINDKSFTVDPYQDGTGLALKRQGPRIAGEVPVNRGVVAGSGTTALIGRSRLGHDDAHLLTSLAEAPTADRFTRLREFGDTALGYAYTSSTGGENPFSYTIDSVWWQQ